MNTVEQTKDFEKWVAALKDRVARAKILARVRMLQMGNPGKTNSVGKGVAEMKIDHGPGYRVYFTKKGKTFFLLLCGGDKSTQKADIKKAQAMIE